MAHALLQPARHAAQQAVPGMVAERVVDRLEAVEVETQQRLRATARG